MRHGLLLGLITGLVGTCGYLLIASSLGGILPMPDAFMESFMESLMGIRETQSFHVASNEMCLIITGHGKALVDFTAQNGPTVEYRWRYKSHVFSKEFSGQGKASESPEQLDILKAGPISIPWSIGPYFYYTPTKMKLKTFSDREFESFKF